MKLKGNFMESHLTLKYNFIPIAGGKNPKIPTFNFNKKYWSASPWHPNVISMPAMPPHRGDPSYTDLMLPRSIPRYPLVWPDWSAASKLDQWPVEARFWTVVSKWFATPTFSTYNNCIIKSDLNLNLLSCEMQSVWACMACLDEILMRPSGWLCAWKIPSGRFLTVTTGDNRDPTL